MCSGSVPSIIHKCRPLSLSPFWSLMPQLILKVSSLYSLSRKLFRLCSSAKISDLHFSDSPFAACPYALLSRLLPLCLLVNPIRKIRNIFSEKFNKCSHFPFSHLAHRTKNYAPINPIATEPAAAAAVAPNCRCCSESREDWRGIGIGRVQWAFHLCS